MCGNKYVYMSLNYIDDRYNVLSDDRWFPKFIRVCSPYVVLNENREVSVICLSIEYKKSKGRGKFEINHCNGEEDSRILFILRVRLNWL